MLDSLDLLTWKFPLNKLCLGEGAGGEGAGIPVVKGVLRYFYESTKYKVVQVNAPNKRPRGGDGIIRDLHAFCLCATFCIPCSMPECRPTKQDKYAVSVLPDIPKVTSTFLSILHSAPTENVLAHCAACEGVK